MSATTHMVWIFIGLNLIHMLADYFIVTNKMLVAKQTGSPILPIVTHASVHAILMTLFLLFITTFLPSIKLGFIQLITHTIIDTLKGKCNVWFPIVKSPLNSPHWMLFGFDQFLHQCVIITMCYISVS